MKIKDSEKIITKSNNLLMTNYEAEKMYTDAHDLVDNIRLKTFFRELALERNEFARAIREEIIKLGTTPQSFEGLNKLSRSYYLIWKNFRPLLKQNHSSGLIEQVCNIEKLTINNYNILLQEFNMPLSLCKLLVEQRDSLHYKMNTIVAKEVLEVL